MPSLCSAVLLHVLHAAVLQLFAANIGWAAPAGLGFALGTDKRLLVMAGDGGLQMTSGAIGDYVKCGSNAIWVCINNDGCKCLNQALQTLVPWSVPCMSGPVCQD